MKQYRKKILIIMGCLSLLVLLNGAYPLYRYLTHDRYKVWSLEVEPAAYEFLADRRRSRLSIVLQFMGNVTFRQTVNV